MPFNEFELEQKELHLIEATANELMHLFAEDVVESYHVVGEDTEFDGTYCIEMNLVHWDDLLGPLKFDGWEEMEDDEEEFDDYRLFYKDDSIIFVTLEKNFEVYVDCQIQEDQQ